MLTKNDARRGGLGSEIRVENMEALPLIQARPSEASRASVPQRLH
jgi:hypothetical protein